MNHSKAYEAGIRYIVGMVEDRINMKTGEDPFRIIWEETQLRFPYGMPLKTTCMRVEMELAKRQKSDEVRVIDNAKIIGVDLAEDGTVTTTFSVPTDNPRDECAHYQFRGTVEAKFKGQSVDYVIIDEAANIDWVEEVKKKIRPLDPTLSESTIDELLDELNERLDDE